MAGEFLSTEQVCLQDFVLPNFPSKKVLPKLGARVFHTECRYDMILGCDVLHVFGVVLDFDTDNIICDRISLPMREFPKANTVEVLLHDLLDCIMDNNGDSSLDNTYAININESKYDTADPVKIAESCTHLTEEQCKDLANLLTNFLKLFNNELKSFTDEKIHLDIDPTITPHRFLLMCLRNVVVQTG